MPDAREVLRGRRIMIVEDEMLVAMELEALLAEQGCAVIGPAPTADRALALLAEGLPDAAILDVNLNGQTATPVAAALRAQNVPFLLATGYSQSLQARAERYTARRQAGQPRATGAGPGAVARRLASRLRARSGSSGAGPAISPALRRRLTPA